MNFEEKDKFILEKMAELRDIYYRAKREGNFEKEYKNLIKQVSSYIDLDGVKDRHIKYVTYMSTKLRILENISFFEKKMEVMI